MPTVDQKTAVPAAAVQIDEIVWEDSERMSGTPCFKGTRVPIAALFDYLEYGDTIDDFAEDFPGVTHEQMIGALYFGKSRLVGSDGSR